MGLFSSKPKKQVVGYLYHLGMHMILGYANADGVKQIWVGEKCVWPTVNDASSEAADSGSNDQSITISASNVFGGLATGKEGGISGDVDIQYGSSTQTTNSYLVSKLGSNISAFRGLLSVILKQVYLGTNAYLKPWSFSVKRTDKLVSGDSQWYSSKAVIRSGQIDGDDLNIVHIIRECLLDKEWGLGWEESDINDSNFKACADTLYDEGYGLSVIWDSSSSMEDFVDRILEIAAASLYQNLSTGLWELGLIRDDYVPASLESFDESYILDIVDFNRPSFGEVVDQVTVNWHDKIWNKNRSITLSDQVMIEKQGGAVIERIFNYQSVCNKTLANKIASRELQLATSMLASMTMKCNRQMSHLKPNDVFKFSWDPLGIETMIVRVLEVNYGNLKDNEVTIHCCEDVFGTSYTIIEDPPNTAWTDPVNDPVDTDYRFLAEAPYWQLCETQNQEIVDTFANDFGVLLPLVVKPSSTPDSYGYDIYFRYDAGDSFEDIGFGSFVPSATLTNNLVVIGSESDWVNLSNVQDLDLVEIDSYAVIGNDSSHEIVLILEVDTTNERIRIARGIFDTKPSVHTSGDRIWFISPIDEVTLIDQDLKDGDTPRIKALTKTGTGTLAEGSATEEVADAFNSRMIRPYLPGNLKINGDRFPEYLYGQPTLTWNHRDRTDEDQLRSIIKHTDSSDYGPEAGTTYTLKIYNQDDVLLRTVTGLSGTSYTYSQVTEEGDSPDGHVSHRLRFVLYSVRGGFDSYQEYDITVERPLYGQIDSVSTVNGSLLVNPRKLNSNPTGTSSTQGRIYGDRKLSGEVSGQSSTSGDVTEV
jgi:hypothetical protein